MSQRTWAVTLAALLLAGGAVAIASNAVGEDFEREGEIPDRGTAYAVDWDSEDAGKLRLSLDPVDGAASPSAQVSLFEGGERVATYTLDEDWPRLDRRVEPADDPAILVHRAVEAEVDVLAEEGHEMDLDRLEMGTETVELAEGEGDAIRTRVALEVDRPPAELALALDGRAEDLEVAALDGDDEVLLEARAESVDTDAGEALAASTNPGNFARGQLVVRVAASSLDGTLALERSSLVEEADHVVEAPEEDSGDSSNTTEAREGNATEPRETNATEDTSGEDEASTDRPELVKVTDVEPGTPVAVSVPADVEALHVVAEDGCGEAVVFGPEDGLVGEAVLDDDEGAEEWNRGGDNDSRDVVAEAPVAGAGEHVLLLANAWEEGELYMRVDEPVDHRELEVREVAGEIDGSNGTVSASSNASAEQALDGGVLGFSWESEGADLDREVRLTGPSGETLYESRGAAAGSANVHWEADHAHPLVGPAGEYTIETEADSAYGDGMSYTFATYVR